MICDPIEHLGVSWGNSRYIDLSKSGLLIGRDLAKPVAAIEKPGRKFDLSGISPYEIS